MKILWHLCMPLLLSALPFSTEVIPEWVKPYGFPQEIAPEKPSQVNLHYLLSDEQKNWEEKQVYHHYIIKILTQAGVEDISQLQICFDPSYQQVTVHEMQVFRDGRKLDRLQSARCQLLQREDDLARQIYTGNLTLLYFLEDIREGDILEYSYSRTGHLPLLSSHYTDCLSFQWASSVDHLVYRLLAAPDCSFQMRPSQVAIEPAITDLTPTLREWSWELFDTSACSFEPDDPPWHDPYAHIQISQYRNWQEVAQKLIPLFTLPDQPSLPDELVEIIRSWKKSTKDPAKLAHLAVRFVQDQIRYLGMEDGMGAFQPRDPLTVFQQRFGDCKDKVFLLHALLKWMDISSTPVLVHTYRGKNLPTRLPSPTLFNHVVLQIAINGLFYWVDPTLHLQGGDLVTSSCFPCEYMWGLPLAKGSSRLVPLPQQIASHPIEFETSYRLISEEVAQLITTTCLRDVAADVFRQFLAHTGEKKFSKESLTDIQGVYPKASIDTPLKVVDDRVQNKILLTDSYILPFEGPLNKRILRLLPWTLRLYLDTQLNPTRQTPYLLRYPLWVKEHIHVENPFYTWTNAKSNQNYEHESICYTYSDRGNGHTADFYFELRHLQDHVAPSAIEEYWKLVSDILEYAPYSIPIVSPTPSQPAESPPLSFLIFFLAVAPMLICWTVLCLVLRKDTRQRVVRDGDLG